MDITQQLCMGCMRPIEADTVICPHCSHSTVDSNKPQYLREKSVLAGKYYIGYTVSIQADNVKYIALDLQTKKAVEIIEFYPEKIVSRDIMSSIVSVNPGQDSLYSTCLQEFIGLWKTIDSLKGNPALPNVLEIFVFNSTAYAVIEKINAIALKKYLDSDAKLLSWNSCVSAFKDIISAIEKLHLNGFYHCAISSSTVLVGSDGKLHLSGFSIAPVKNPTSIIYDCVQTPYAPIEQSDRRFQIGAYSDVYSLAAVMYFSITGIEPQSAVERAVEDAMVIPFQIAGTLNSSVIDILYSALQVFPKNRTKTVFEFMSGINGQAISQKVIEKNDETEVSDDPIDDFENAQEESENIQPKGNTAAKIILSTILILILLFSALYPTVLYKEFRIDFLDEALSAFSFLPLNSETQPTDLNDETQKTTEPEYVTVADFLSLTYSDISNNKTFNKNFKINFVFEASETVTKNSIISQSIEKGSKVEKGSEITITVSTGKPISVLKDVIGLQYEDAYKTLTADGFVVEKKMLENDGAQIPGTVFTMSLVAGLEFEKGTTVVLSVWDEIKTTVPETSEESTFEPSETIINEETNII